MHEKCIIWWFEIAVFSVMGPCDLNGQQRRFGLNLLLQSFDGLCRQIQNAPPKHSLPCMYQTIQCPDSDHLINPHHCEHLKSYTKNYSELKHWWKCHVAKTELYKSTIYLYTVYNITHFFHKLWKLLYITSEKTEETNHFQYKYTFMIRTTYVEFQTSTEIIPQGNLTSDREIKQHVWQWKAKEDCSSSAVPCVIHIIWMTVTITYNEAQSFALSLTIFWHNPTAPWCDYLNLARF